MEKRIINDLMNFKSRIPINVKDQAEIESFIQQLRSEHTVLFHLGDVSYEYYPIKKSAVLLPQYLYSKAEYGTLLDELQRIVVVISDKVMKYHTAYERELMIHDTLCKNIEYREEGVQSHSIVGPLLYKKGVCDGISKAAKVLFQVCGIEAHVLSGIAKSHISGIMEPHAWNVVSINNHWYHLDITFDNTLSTSFIRYDYFNLSTQEILRDHSINKNSPYANIVCSTSNNFYCQNGLFFTESNAVLSFFKNALVNKKTELQLQVSERLIEELLPMFEQCLEELNINAAYQIKINEMQGVFSWDIKYHEI